MAKEKACRSKHVICFGGKLKWHGYKSASFAAKHSKHICCPFSTCHFLKFSCVVPYHQCASHSMCPCHACLEITQKLFWASGQFSVESTGMLLNWPKCYLVLHLECHLDHWNVISCLLILPWKGNNLRNAFFCVFFCSL